MLWCDMVLYTTVYFLYLQFLIVGVELDTSGHRELKDGNIKLMDLITQLNEDKIRSREWFEQSTRDKTRPQLTLLRSIKSPVIRSFLTKGIHKRLNLFIYTLCNPIPYSKRQMSAGNSHQIDPEPLSISHWKWLWFWTSQNYWYEG